MKIPDNIFLRHSSAEAVDQYPMNCKNYFFSLIPETPPTLKTGRIEISLRNENLITTETSQKGLTL